MRGPWGTLRRHWVQYEQEKEMVMWVKIRHSGKRVGKMVRALWVYAVHFGAHHVPTALTVVRSVMIGPATGSYPHSHGVPGGEWEMPAKPVRRRTRAVSSALNLG